jgi:hypothetical protein
LCVLLGLVTLFVGGVAPLAVSAHFSQCRCNSGVPVLAYSEPVAEAPYAIASLSQSCTFPCAVVPIDASCAAVPLWGNFSAAMWSQPLPVPPADCTQQVWSGTFGVLSTLQPPRAAPLQQLLSSATAAATRLVPIASLVALRVAVWHGHGSVLAVAVAYAGVPLVTPHLAGGQWLSLPATLLAFASAVSQPVSALPGSQVSLAVGALVAAGSVFSSSSGASMSSAAWAAVATGFLAVALELSICAVRDRQRRGVWASALPLPHDLALMRDGMCRALQLIFDLHTTFPVNGALALVAVIGTLVIFFLEGALWTPTVCLAATTYSSIFVDFADPFAFDNLDYFGQLVIEISRVSGLLPGV